MALYHFHADLIRRSKGQAVVAAAAYRAGEKLHDEYYGNDADFTKKGGVVYTEIFLPPQTPAKYKDRETLWNAVEKVEKHPKAQLAYSYDIALQNELTLEENIALARRFVQEQFVAKGMIADFAVHAPSKDVPNPHFHVLCPIRPVLENGQWGEKQNREYVLDEQGNRMRDESGVYVFKAVPTTDWGQKETLTHWREEWANCVNQAFEEKGLSCRIDHRANAERGMDELPTVHEGPAVQAMEAKGIVTEKGELNRIIRKLNASLREIRKKLRSVLDWISEITEKMQEPHQPELGELLAMYLRKRDAGAWSNKGKLSNLHKTADIVNYLTGHNILTVDELHLRADEAYRAASDLNDQVKDVKAQIKAIDDQIHLSQYLTEYKSVIDKLNSFHFKGRREKFKQEHEKEISFYYMAARKLKGHLDKELNLTASKLAMWKDQRAKLTHQVSELSARHSAIYVEQKKLLNIQRIVDNTLHEWEREHGLVQHKDRPAER